MDRPGTTEKPCTLSTWVPHLIAWFARTLPPLIGAVAETPRSNVPQGCGQVTDQAATVRDHTYQQTWDRKLRDSRGCGATDDPRLRRPNRPFSTDFRSWPSLGLS